MIEARSSYFWADTSGLGEATLLTGCVMGYLCLPLQVYRSQGYRHETEGTPPVGQMHIHDTCTSTVLDLAEEVWETYPRLASYQAFPTPRFLSLAV